MRWPFTKKIRLENHTPRFHVGGPEENANLYDANSLPRKSIPFLDLVGEAEKLAQFYLDNTDELLAQAQACNQYIVENFDFSPRLISLTARGIMLENYPALLQDEMELWELFENNQITENELAIQMRQKIADKCAENEGMSFNC